MRPLGAVCHRWHVAVLAVLFACSLMSMFFLDLKLISKCVVLAPSTIHSSFPFLHILLSFCLCIPTSGVSVFLPIYLSTYLSIYLFVCLSVCQPVAATWRYCNIMSALPAVVDLGVCLTFLPVAWPCGCLFVCMPHSAAVLRWLDLMLISTCGVSVLSAVDGMSLSSPCCLRAA